MALAISTNFAINANTALNAMNKSQSLMGKSISRISTGNRAANPADDPLSYFSGNKIKGDIEGYDALYNGVQDAAAQANVADSSLSSIIDVLTEMKAKATAYDNTTDTDTKAAISTAYKQLSSSLDSFINTQYKGSSVWNSSLSVQTSLGVAAEEEETEINLFGEKLTGLTTATANVAGGEKKEDTTNKIIFSVKDGLKATDTFSVGDRIGTLTLKKDSAFLKAYKLDNDVDLKIKKGSSGYDLYYGDNKLGTATISASNSPNDTNFDLTAITFDQDVEFKLSDEKGIAFSAIKSEIEEETLLNTDYKPSTATNTFRLGTTNWKLKTATNNTISTTGGQDKLTNSNLEDVELLIDKPDTNNIAKIYSSGDTTAKTQLGTIYIGNNVIQKIEWETDESVWKTAGVVTDSGSSSGGSSNTFSVNGISDPSSTLSGLNGGVELSANQASTIQTAIEAIAKQRTELGGSLSALDSISSNISSVSTATEAAYTAVTEANIAKEMTNYVRNNVYSQAAQAMISQANQSLAQVLNLLQ